MDAGIRRRPWPAALAPALACALACALGGAAPAATPQAATPAAAATTSAASATTSAPAAADTTRPRNIILMIADGCGFNHLRAAALWRDDQDLFADWRDLPVRLAVSTFAEGERYDPDDYWANGPLGEPPTDSAAAATALATGHKTRNGRLSLSTADEALETVVEAAERAGRATGLVTTVPFCHATPAAFAAHNASRSAYEQIANELLLRSAVDVLMGAGHPGFDKQGQPTAAAEYRYVGGADTWRALLAGAAGGDADGDGRPDPWALVETDSAFAALATGAVPRRVVGVARARETLQQQRPGDPQAAPFAEPPLAGVPTLATMTRGALNVLDDDPDGFFLMVEGGAVDWASHERQPGRMIEELVDFHEAVAAARAWIAAHGGWRDNLLVITADHETGYLTGPPPAAGDWPPCRARQPLAGRGRGQVPDLRFNGGDHTNALVPLLAAGAGSGRLAARATGLDPVRGPYLDNTAVGAVLQELAVSR